MSRPGKRNPRNDLLHIGCRARGLVTELRFSRGAFGGAVLKFASRAPPRRSLPGPGSPNELSGIEAPEFGRRKQFQKNSERLQLPSRGTSTRSRSRNPNLERGSQTAGSKRACLPRNTSPLPEIGRRPTQNSGYHPSRPSPTSRKRANSSAGSGRQFTEEVFATACRTVNLARKVENRRKTLVGEFRKSMGKAFLACSSLSPKIRMRSARHESPSV